MHITIEMASSINGLIATLDGNEDFLYERNYEIMLELLKNYDCLVWGNTTFKNVVSWGDGYINDLKDILVIVFSKETKNSKYQNVIYCNSMEQFYEICKTKNIINVLVSGGAHINTLFMNNTDVSNVIINYNPVVLNQGINLFEGNYFEKKLSLDKIVKEKDDIVQIWYNVKHNFNDNLINELTNIFNDNKEQRIVVLGTMCTGKTTILNTTNIGKDMDKEIFPLLTKEEIDYVCSNPWTEEIGKKMDELVRTKLKVIPGTPLFGTVLVDCDLIVYLHINDELLKERTQKRNADFINAKNMQQKIEEEIKKSNIKSITLEM